jgi:hypothetical protein
MYRLNNKILLLDELNDIDLQACRFDLPAFDGTYPKAGKTSMQKEALISTYEYLGQKNAPQNDVPVEDQVFIAFLQLKMQILLLKLFPLSDEEIKKAKTKAKDKLAKFGALLNSLQKKNPIFWHRSHLTFSKISEQLLSICEGGEEDSDMIKLIIAKNQVYENLTFD